MSFRTAAVKTRNQAGDTLVEVLMATVVLSMVLAAAFTLSNRATRINQSALEKTEVSNILREQAELIKRAMTNPGQPPLTTPTAALTVAAGFPRHCLNIPRGQGFTINDAGAMSSGFKTEGQFYHIWIERAAVTPTSTVANFTVRACWEGIGDTPVQHTGLVVRVPIDG